MCSLQLALLLLLLLLPSSSSASTCSSSACITEEYNKMDLPPTENNSPVQVNVTLQLTDIFSVDHEAFTFRLGSVFRFKWFDNRISLNKSMEPIDQAFIENIWQPHIYIYNSRSGLEKSDKAGARVVKQDNHHLVDYLIETEIDLICQMNYSKFPFDNNKCILALTEMNNGNETVVFNTKSSHDPATRLNRKTIRHYDVKLEYLQGEETSVEAWEPQGKYFSVAGIRMTLVHKPDKYLLVYFLPTSMFTVTSWFSFLIPPTSYPARTALLVTIFLCQIGIFNAVIKNTPNENGGDQMHQFIISAGLTALEVWCLAMIGIVFLTFIAYIIILVWLRCRGPKVTPIKTMYEKNVATKTDSVEEEGEEAKVEAMLFGCIAVTSTIFLVCYYIYYI